MVSASFMPAGEANTFPPPLLPEPRRRSSTTSRCSRGSTSARTSLNSLLVAVARHAAARVLINAHGRLRVRQAALPRPRPRCSASCSPALVIPAQVGDAAAVPAAQDDGAGEHATSGVMIPGLASIFGIFLVRQYALSIPDDLLDAARVDGASEFRIFWSIVLPVLRPILVTLAVFTFLSDVERLHVAADRPDRRAQVHAAGGAREPVGRARAGHRADDGGLGAHRAAGAGRVPGAPALLHRGAS